MDMAKEANQTAQLAAHQHFAYMVEEIRQDVVKQVNDENSRHDVELDNINTRASHRIFDAAYTLRDQLAVLNGEQSPDGDDDE